MKLDTEIVPKMRYGTRIASSILLMAIGVSLVVLVWTIGLYA